MKRVSLLFVTMDRYDLTVRCLTQALERAGYSNYEILSVDNGSQDSRVPNWVESLAPSYLVYHRRNKENQGYGPMLNQMLLRASGEFICIIDPDLELPNNWLSTLVACNEAIPNSGISGIHCVQSKHQERLINGYRVFPGAAVYGVKFFRASLLSTVGYYNEHIAPVYGNEDTDMNYRMDTLGLLNYYVDLPSAVHAGEDVAEQSDYRKMKWTELYATVPRMKAEWARYKMDGYYIPPPQLR